MLTTLRSVLIPVSALLAATPASALQATQEVPGFSILAPQPETETPETEEAAVPAAHTGPAGAHLTREAYLARRGEASQDITRTRWRIEVSELDGTRISQREMELVIGDGYVFEITDENRTIYDFRLNRTLRRTPAIDGPVMVNTPIAAHVHRQMDIFTAFTRGGELDEITGPGGTSFERFWIEAAMGVRLSAVELLETASEDGRREARRDEMGSVIFGLQPGSEGDAVSTDLLRRWLRHNAPIHPDALALMEQETALPDQLSYLVFSPSSPMGRREVWTRLSATTDEADFPWPEGLEPADATSYITNDGALAILMAEGLEAAAAPELAPQTGDFLDASDRAAERSDPAGAYLELYQASHHLGPCTPATSASPICQRINQVTASGLGNAPFERLMTTLSQMTSEREAALDGLQAHRVREGFAGATANLLAAQTVATLRAAGSQHRPELAPSALFAAAGVRDRYAPLTYWHAGRYAASQNEIETAWLLFDLARSLPASGTTTPVREADAMTRQLQTLAPGFFGPLEAY